MNKPPREKGYNRACPSPRRIRMAADRMRRPIRRVDRREKERRSFASRWDAADEAAFGLPFRVKIRRYYT